MKVKRFVLLVTILVNCPLSVHAKGVIRHNIKVLLKPNKHIIKAEDKITLPQEFVNAEILSFRLHKNLKPVSITKGVKFLDANPSTDKYDISTQYHIEKPQGILSFTLRYSGKIYEPIEHQEEEYARSYGETSGIISSDGIYLGEESLWYPNFINNGLTFKLDVICPGGWSVVSQGKRYQSTEGKVRHIVWESLEPQEEIYIVGGKFSEYRKTSGRVTAEVYLRSQDKKLADSYLDTTLQYINMYSKLIGAYPYSKFALVENFWETGYGMPSFTLMGSKIIRFPFIIHSSYPHEILHNWWGNSVFVDYQAGNWCEGLTAYLADYLIKEQHGKGLEYRRTALQRYTDYVNSNKDFPITAFRSRHSSVTQVIGYDKTMMFFHMLRREMGEKLFRNGLQSFYKQNKFKRASFDDIQKAFSEVYGKSLKSEFEQWVKRTGAPKLSIEEVSYEGEDGQYSIKGILKQTQHGSAYRLNVPVVIYSKKRKEAYRKTLLMENKELRFSLKLTSQPIRLDIDPEFDLFRRLDRNEIPPALSQAFGSDDVLIVLPSTAPDNLKKNYLKLANSWKNSQFSMVSIRFDNEISKLPMKGAIWLFGWENKFGHNVKNMLKDYNVLIKDKITIGKTQVERKTCSAVFAARRPENQNSAIVWVATDNETAISGLGRKLPHYRKYSYLIFNGDAPSISLKGQWPTLHSPMSVLLRPGNGSNTKTQYEKRSALAYMPSAF